MSEGVKGSILDRKSVDAGLLHSLIDVYGLKDVLDALSYYDGPLAAQDMRVYRMLSPESGFNDFISVVQANDVTGLRAYARELHASLTELSEWMRARTGPKDGTRDMLIKAQTALTRGIPK